MDQQSSFFLKFHQKNEKQVTFWGFNLKLAMQDDGGLYTNSGRCTTYGTAINANLWKCKRKAGKLMGEKGKSNLKSEKKKNIKNVPLKSTEFPTELWTKFQGMKEDRGHRQLLSLLWRSTGTENMPRFMLQPGQKWVDSRKGCECCFLGIYKRQHPNKLRHIWEL